ncbi:LacI family DNA-binding transcriptional regulator [Simiduia agarivorans]|uniref:LacI family transcriptional regulator n=1 Tax=Simiduia agarivorans (strain DSM 21679 / JCM 13881 / BCRC 17597 / SA1) TaxID=1117647 RepID=K4KRU7_SIMAS|nr:LacI family DNA-binding transcriptional regulator [Simiduia agarivorans]AFV01011.1 LacI family transcriptional regulator [Simiduia agarivorans SA1 = DSM 21679]
MKATIKDVAKLAGVSFKTVSRVINREPSVGQELQDKVWAAVKELNYQPNLGARLLRGAASSIGFIYDNPNSNYVIDMQNGILQTCRAEGYELVIHPCDARSPDILNELNEMLDRSRVGGLVLTPPLSETPDVIDALRKKNVRFVRILSGSEAPDAGSPCVFIDDRTAGFDITDYLIGLGHTRIGFLGGDLEHASSTERLEGYKDALKKHGLPIDEDLMLPGEYAFESGIERSRALLSRPDRPTAIFACNDEIAAGTLFAARILGVAVPEELSIVGFEDSPFSRQAWPKLTTAQQPNNTIAQTAAKLLINDIRTGRDAGQAAPSQGFYPKLVVRDSTANA